MKRRQIALAFIALVLTLTFAVAPGCGLIEALQQPPSESPAVTEPAAPPSTQPVSPQTQLPTLPAATAQALPSIADVVARVKPSVVSINTQIVFAGSFTSEAAGSGWIISADGLIVTNNHVVEGAQSITVTLDDGREFEVDLDTVATDPISDLAVLKVNATGLPAAKIGNSNLMRVGDWVVAIGNSLNEGVRATQGIISRTDVHLAVDEATELFGMLETDAAINPGNSGGPLVNLAGEVVGITSAKITEAEGTGFAISISEAMPIIQDLTAKGFVSRPFLGVQSDSASGWVARLDLQVDEGVVILGVVPNSPASAAGLQIADVVVRFDGKDVKTGSELVRAIRSSAIGKEVEIVLWRGATQMTVKAVLAERRPNQ